MKTITLLVYVRSTYCTKVRSSYCSGYLLAIRLSRSRTSREVVTATPARVVGRFLRSTRQSGVFGPFESLATVFPWHPTTTERWWSTVPSYLVPWRYFVATRTVLLGLAYCIKVVYKTRRQFYTLITVILHGAFSVDQKFLMVRQTIGANNNLTSILASDPRFIKYMTK